VVGGGGEEATFNPSSPGSPTPVTIDSSASLMRLACPTTSLCVATSPSVEVTFNPSSPGTPTPATIDSAGELQGLACPSATQCTAVNFLGQETTFDPSSPGTAIPAAADSSGLVTGIACASTTQCVAVEETGQAVIGTVPSYALTVSNAGSGTGTVTSSPAGISCGSTCSSSYTNGTSVTLSATAAPGSVFAGWSGGGCSGTATCTVTLRSAIAVTATFDLIPKKPKVQCVVPKVKGKSLAAAKRAIKAHSCRVGKIERVFSRAVKNGHVVSQKPHPGRHLRKGSKVNVNVSKGRRH
jgi:hypothetical protein